MNKQNKLHSTAQHKLTVEFILRWLVDENMVLAADAERLIKNRSADRTKHPLVIIGEQNWHSQLPPGKLLSVEVLTEWLAAHIKMEYFHVDPLKLNFA